MNLEKKKKKREKSSTLPTLNSETWKRTQRDKWWCLPDWRGQLTPGTQGARTNSIGKGPHQCRGPGKPSGKRRVSREGRTGRRDVVRQRLQDGNLFRNESQSGIVYPAKLPSRKEKGMKTFLDKKMESFYYWKTLSRKELLKVPFQEEWLQKEGLSARRDYHEKMKWWVTTSETVRRISVFVMLKTSR